VRRKLEDYTLMIFPSVDDIPVALAALLADPFVRTQRNHSRWIFTREIAGGARQ